MQNIKTIKTLTTIIVSQLYYNNIDTDNKLKRSLHFSTHRYMAGWGAYMQLSSKAPPPQQST